MRKFRVTVNGISYEVDVEEVGVAQPQRIIKQEQAPPKPQTKNINGVMVTSPMPGNVWKLSKKDGDTVKKGEVILILEAMKMENDIIATEDGKISYNVDEGAQVSAGDILAIIE
ncbi:MAG: biotin/lipoyl-containing protein [Christensenellales bacterium]|jgi:biotin carboxyl carrier protein